MSSSVPKQQWIVTAEDTMGGRVVLFRADDKSEARTARSSFARDGAYTRIQVEAVQT